MNGLNDRQRRFCEELLGGCSQAEAYRRAGYRSRRPETEAAALARNPAVSRYLESVREKTKSERVASAKEAQEFLTLVLRTPLGDIGGDHILAQEYEKTGSGAKARLKVKGYSKIEAIRELARMRGWYKPDRTENTVQVTGLAEVMKSIRAGRGGGK